MNDRKLKDRIRDKIREEWGKLRLLSWKARLAYVWDYYKPLMVGIIAVIAVINIGITVYHNLQTDTLLYAYMVNCNTYYVDSQTLTEDYTAYLSETGVKELGKNEEFEIDTSILLDDDDYSTNYAYQMKFTAVISAKLCDVALMDVEKFTEYAGWSYFLDLRELLTDEQLEKWADRIVYLENEDGESIPCALDLTDAPIVEEYGIYSDTVYSGVVVNSENMELCASFFEWLLAE